MWQEKLPLFCAADDHNRSCHRRTSIPANSASAPRRMELSWDQLSRLRSTQSRSSAT
jgi:hypothetical protein